MVMKKTYNRSAFPSPRRVRLLFVAVFVIVLMILYYTADARRVQGQKFYQNTVGAMDAKAAAARDRDSSHDDDSLFQKLKPNYGAGSGSGSGGDMKPPPQVLDKPKFDVPSNDGEGEDGEERSVAGRKTMKVSKGKDTVRIEGYQGVDPEVKEEFNDIMKRSPIIIFSKSYCPFSKKAKDILLDKYNIVPSPFVVELDQHPLGTKLQNLLGQHTDRRTVPNILISGLSIGGGDEISELHEDGKLIEKIRSLGDKRIMEVTLKDEE
ncbi:hypothetical protein FQN54_002159 [Arachnomyces sp. PD_36]|nr:hypothetical protein FQN54_002159 [Arachnomyces sp. PD_36]